MQAHTALTFHEEADCFNSFSFLPQTTLAFLGWFWLEAPGRPGRSLHPSEPHVQFPKKAGAILRNFRSVRCVRMDEPLWLTYRSSLIYTLCYAPTSPFLKFRKSTTPSVTEALPGIAKAGNEEGERNRRVHGGKKLLYNQPWHLTRERVTQIKENLYLSLSHVSSLTKTINSNLMFVKEIIIIYKELSCPFSHLNHKILKTGKHYFKVQQLEFPKDRELSHDHWTENFPMTIQPAGIRKGLEPSLWLLITKSSMTPNGMSQLEKQYHCFFLHRCTFLANR